MKKEIYSTWRPVNGILNMYQDWWVTTTTHLCIQSGRQLMMVVKTVTHALLLTSTNVTNLLRSGHSKKNYVNFMMFDLLPPPPAFLSEHMPIKVIQKMRGSLMLSDSNKGEVLFCIIYSKLTKISIRTFSSCLLELLTLLLPTMLIGLHLAPKFRKWPSSQVKWHQIVVLQLSPLACRWTKSVGFYSFCLDW